MSHDRWMTPNANLVAGMQIAFMNSMAQMSPTPKDKRPVLHGVMG